MSNYTRIVRRTISQTEGWFDVIKKQGAKEKDTHRLSIGIDPSLVGTGIAIFNDGELRDYRGWTDIKSLQKKHPQHLVYFKPTETTHGARLARIRMIGAWVGAIVSNEIIHGMPDICVALEGYAFAARARSISDLHELGGYIKQTLLTLDVPFRIYDPMSIKLAATGSGSADKGDIKIACLKKLKLDLTPYGKAGENIADACMIGWLLEQERAIRDGRKKLEDVDPDVRKVLLRTTKAEPTALISKPWIHEEAIKLPAVVYD